MTFENQNLTSDGTQNKKLSVDKNKDKEVLFEKKLRIFFVELFEDNEPEKRLTKFKSSLFSFLIVDDRAGLEQAEIDKIKDEFRDCCLLENEEEFINRGMASLKSLLEWKKDNEQLFEVKLRENFVSASGFTPLNESLSYGKHKDEVYIHVAPSETLSAGAQFSLLKDGLRKLQEVLRNDNSINKVSATSWIIATEKGGEIMKKLGFTINGEIPAKLKEEHFRFEDRPVFGAFIKRNDFLDPKKYQ